MGKILITSKGIKKTLQKFDELQSIAEYIWNGFDAGATRVELKVERNELGGMERLSITDNGYGIDRQVLERKFTPFYESEKQIDPDSRIRMTSTMHGKNGIGRLTFHSFASQAVWHTIYKEGQENKAYSIHIDADTLDMYSQTEPEPTAEKPGTKVVFDMLHRDIELEELRRFLAREFGWFLELHAASRYRLIVDGKKLNYNRLVAERQRLELEHRPTGTLFEVSFIRWEERMNNESSKLYFLDSAMKERYKQPTSFNNKGDGFYHSVYIQSKLFDHFDFISKDQYGQMELSFGMSRRSEPFQFIIEEINTLIHNKRRPFLRVASERMVEELAAVDAFPVVRGPSASEGDSRQVELEQVLKELYRIQPRIFVRLNPEQKKAFVHMLDLLLETASRERLLEVLEQVMDVQGPELEELRGLLQGE